MGWNNGKFKKLRIGSRRDVDGLLFTPGMENVLVPEQSVRDLGVMLDMDLNFKEQRSVSLAKAKNKASWVMRTFRSRSVDLMRRLWKSLI